MNLRIKTKNHASDLKIGFLAKSISTPFSQARTMPTARELIITLIFQGQIPLKFRLNSHAWFFSLTIKPRNKNFLTKKGEIFHYERQYCAYGLKGFHINFINFEIKLFSKKYSQILKSSNRIVRSNFGLEDRAVFTKCVIIVSVGGDFDSNERIGRLNRKSSDLILLNRCLTYRSRDSPVF